jgi:hypothetical protein
MVLTLHQASLLNISIIHGDGTTTAAKKGGDNIGFSGHKKIKGDKVVAFCDRNCNVIAPFISAPGNPNESPLLRKALPEVTRIAGSISLDLQATIVSLDGVYDCPRNRKAIFNRGMVPNINANPRGRKSTKRGCKPFFDEAIIKNPRSKLRGIGGRKEADQKNAASCGEYVPKEIQGAVHHYRACFWLGGQIPPPAAPVRSPQPVALRIQIIGLFDDKPTPLLLASNHHRTRYKMALGAP